ncbi:MAG: T9SS type A sorting domain-containing protein [bacterium]
MKRIVPALVILALLVSCTALSQVYKPGWVHKGMFPPLGKGEKDIGAGGRLKDTLHWSYVHGIEVSPDGKVWIQNYTAYARDTIYVTNYRYKSNPDSLRAQWTTVRKLYCYLPDGTPASFSPMLTGVRGTKVDTMGGEISKSTSATNPLYYWSVNSGRGLRKDPSGNILAMYWDYMYRINYKTGQGMAGGAAGLTAFSACAGYPGIDKDGNIFINGVLPNGPIKIFDKDFNFIGNAVDSVKGYSRAAIVSADGNDVYYGGYTQNAVMRYHSDNGVLGPYSKIDTLLKGFVCESFAWHPKTGYLWASAGSYAGMPNGWWDTKVVQNYTPGTWYGIDTKTMTIKDSINWAFGYVTTADKGNERPRGIAFSPTGDTAYVCVFGGGSMPGVRYYIFSDKAVNVEVLDKAIPEGYALSQNYPNPFNPSTTIRFSIPQRGMTTLKVYDVMGREVTTLLNEFLEAGTFSKIFDAKNLTSGTYMYVMTSGSQRLTGKMILMK